MRYYYEQFRRQDTLSFVDTWRRDRNNGAAPFHVNTGGAVGRAGRIFKQLGLIKGDF